jgi:hypothetical protein
MDKRPNISTQQKSKPSKILMSFALLIAISLPYFLVTHFSQHKDAFTKQSITLPKLIDPQAIESAKQPQSIAIADAVKKTKDNEWQVVTPRPGDSMAIIFSRLGLSAQNLHAVLERNPHAKALTSIKPNQKLQFLINKNRLEKLIIPVDNIDTLTVFRKGKIYKTHMDSKKLVSHDLYITGTVKGSLFSTAQRLSIPIKLIHQMTQILNKQVDFSRSISWRSIFSCL